MTPYSTVGFVVKARFSALQFTVACHCFVSTEQHQIPSFFIADGIKKSGAVCVNLRSMQSGASLTSQLSIAHLP
jgi:hypothetical protein